MTMDLHVAHYCFYGNEVRLTIQRVNEPVINFKKVKSDTFGVQLCTYTNPTGGEQIANQVFHLTGVFFINGKFVSKEEMRNKLSSTSKFLQELEAQNVIGAIQTRFGRYQPCHQNDVIVII